MPAPYLYQVKILAYRLGLAYLLFFLCRVLFFLINREYFSSTGTGEFLLICVYGLRFDSFSIVALNAVFILLSLAPGQLFFRRSYQKVLFWLYMSTNTAGVLANGIDFAYFPFIKKRSGADLFNQVGGQTDMSRLLPSYVRDFWWVLVIVAALSFFLAFLYRKIKVTQPVPDRAQPKRTVVAAVVFLFCVGISVLALRGGTQRYPIDIINAGQYVRPEQVPLVLNTPFTLLKSLGQEELVELSFFGPEELGRIYSPLHEPDSGKFQRKNVVVLILESFAKEYTGLGKTGVSYTPFLDSLLRHALVFSNGFANGSKSIEGIPAILSGLPHLMENPFINSYYSNNFQTTFATLLGKEGYHTAFFHGGTNGTMNFDTWSRLAGYAEYYGRDEYGNDADFDGFWGIWDEPFLQYSITKLNHFPEPFHSAIFTLSSHHPYTIPKKYRNRFPSGPLPNTESVAYADHALRLFFEKAKASEWFRNTVFVLCADHTSLSDHPFYKNIVGQQAIPIAFYCPDNSLKGEDSRSFSQADILPSLMDLLNYPKPFFAFGQSAFRKKNNNCYYYVNGNHLMIADSMMLSFNKTELQSVYNFLRDSTISNEIIGRYPALENEKKRQFHAFIQTFNRCMRENAMRVPPEGQPDYRSSPAHP